MAAQILIADDDEIARDIMAHVLSDRGHAVTVAVDGVAALAWLRRGRFHVAVLGDHLPLIDGATAAQRICRGGGPAAGTRLNLTIALSYGARAEILAAARSAMEAAIRGELAPAELTEASFGRGLFTAGMPDPDLIIRTSGEQRISNFLLWQAAYAELAFQPVLWPDFGAEHFAAALADYAARERRFGARVG